MAADSPLLKRSLSERKPAGTLMGVSMPPATPRRGAAGAVAAAARNGADAASEIGRAGVGRTGSVRAGIGAVAEGPVAAGRTVRHRLPDAVADLVADVAGGAGVVVAA